MIRRVVRWAQKWPWRPWRRLRTQRQRIAALLVAGAVISWGGLELHEKWSERNKGRYRSSYQRPFPVMTLSATSLGMQEDWVMQTNYMLANWVTLEHGANWARKKGTDAQAELGRMLFHEKRLSRNHDISCNSCHNLRAYGMDRLEVSIGHAGRRGRRNAPTVYNAAAQVAQFWDGRADSVEEQAQRPILEPTEMAMGDEQRVLDTLNSMPEYQTLFRRAFPDEPEPISMSTVGRAIGAFERRLFISAPWDDFIEGDENAVSDEAKRGFVTFTNVGCISCHAGPTLGAGSLEKLGVSKPWPNQTDQGRYEVTGQDFDRMRFKPPSLRNSGKTAPYFHDASSDTLEDAIKRMGWHQLGRELTSEQIMRIAAFLRSLTGGLPEQLLESPALPPSTAATPEPDPTPIPEPAVGAKDDAAMDDAPQPETSATANGKRPMPAATVQAR